jgi:mannose-6-phosphate isomerase-like protein (cupin superfamily)
METDTALPIPEHLLAQLPGPVERLGFQGVSIDVLVSAETTGGAWSLVQYTAPAQCRGTPLHHHVRTTERFHLLAGRLRFRVGDRERLLVPGEAVVVHPGREHCFANPFGEPARFLIHASPGGLEGYFREVAALVACAPTWPPIDLASLTALAERYDTLSK